MIRILSFKKKSANQDQALKKQVNTIYQSGLFNTKYYLAEQPNIPSGMDPLEHYIKYGVEEGKNPHPLFNTNYYFKQCLELNIEIDGINPLWHYLTKGAKLGLDPNPYFDTSYYLEQNPDVADSSINPLGHFIFFGAREKRNPSQEFNIRHYLTENQDVEESGVNPLIHYIQYGCFEDSYSKAKINISKEDYLKLRQIEPKLISWSKLELLPTYTIPRHDRASNAYFKLADMIDEEFSHLYVLPGIGYGGSEKVAINYTKLIIKEVDKNAPLILMADHGDQKLQEYFPEEARIIYLDSLADNVKNSDKIKILARLIIQAQPRVVHNFNSKLCWMAFRDYHRQLNCYTQLYASMFAHDMDDEGVPSGYSIDFFNQCIDYMKGIFLDNSYFKRELASRFALEKHNLEKLLVAYNPIELLQETPDKNSEAANITEGSHKIMWASRLDKEKRPDLLRAIAKAMPEIEFHVFGQSVLKTFSIENLNGITNLKLHGPYKCFSELPTKNFSLFLYTSERDGLPNVIQEAASCGLPIVASDVGGVSDLINANTGWLISEPENVNAYVQAIKEALLSQSERKKRANAALELLRTRHSWQQFSKTVHSMDGYMNA